MKKRRRECLFLWGVTRFQKLRPRCGMEVQLLVEQAQQRLFRSMAPIISDALNNSGTCFRIAESMPRPKGSTARQ